MTKFMTALDSDAGLRSGMFSGLDEAVAYLRAYWKLAEAHSRFEGAIAQSPVMEAPAELPKDGEQQAPAAITAPASTPSLLVRPPDYLPVASGTCGPWLLDGVAKWCDRKHRFAGAMHHWGQPAEVKT